ncbi:MAG TPA: Rieske (2Fe-2S) protein [Coriobacteriia bacterium]|nr:Rieske (2Fe-2S) protein [Coriobacteriia bacterium]
MSDWFEGPDVSDMSEGDLRQFEIEGHEMLVARTGGGYFVSDNHCPHLGGRLSKGTLEGTVIRCHLHHSRFDLRDGHVVEWTDFHGAVKTVAELARHPRPLRVYACEVRDDGILLVGDQLPPTQ